MGLDTVEFLLHAEKELGIKITDEEASKILTVGDFSALCYQKLILKPNNHLNEAQIFSILQRILQENFVNPSTEIKREHFIVKDLCLE